MTETLLTGLTGSHPMGALAAFGLLRAAAELHAELGAARLSWRRRGDWIAVLHLEREVTPDDLVACLLGRQRQRAAAPELQWSDDIKVAPDRFSHLARAAVAAATPAARTLADFMAAYGSELVTARSKPEVKPTALHMTAGQQRFLRQARELAESLDPGETPRQRDAAASAFREALFGPWQYRDRQHSFGWDPSTERLHALSARSPTSEAPLGVRAAVWLAFEALPLFPSVAVGRRLRTAGFNEQNESFSWPVWEAPLTLDTVRSLLLLMGAEGVNTLKARGVAAVFRVQRAVSDHGYGAFRAAELVVAP